MRRVRDIEEARKLKGSAAPVVVVCPHGKSGAKNAYEYLASRGINEDRLRILDGGIAEWPFKELFVSGRP